LGNTVQIIDQSVVEELLSLGDDGDPELLLDLIEMFAEDAPIKLGEVLRGFEAQDFESIERAAHSLKGSSGNLGATQLQRVCESLQAASRSHELERLRGLADELEREFAVALDALRAVQQRYAS